MSYQHGLYGSIIESSESINTSTSIPVYFGIAPMHRLEEKDRQINKPVLIRSKTEAARYLGFLESDDFKKFTLSAAVYAHFCNKILPIGPIVVVNVLNLKNATSTTEEIALVNGVAKIDKHVLIDSVTIQNYDIENDYELSYTAEGSLKIVFTNDAPPEKISITYKTIDPDIVTTQDIIGTYDKKLEIRSGIKSLEDVYEELNVIPTMLTAPGFNHQPDVRQALVSATKKIADKWEATAFTDIDSNTVDNIEDAIKWKKSKAYNSNEEKVFWPMGVMGEKEIWLSVIGIVAKMQTDYQNNNIPYQSPSNKKIDISGIVAKGKNLKFSQNRANDLNASGITTAIFNGGKYVLWGPHMANYEYGVTSKPEEIFDVNIFMQKYLLNDFQKRNGDEIDTAMNRHDVDRILNDEQDILSSYVSAGQLLYGTIAFKSEENAISDMINGDFKFNTLVTNTPLGKSLTQQVQYTSKGLLDAYSDNEEEEES